jgi:starch synthase
MSSSLRILMLSAEMVPFTKIGGPADVVGALPKALRRLGHDVRVAMPGYRSVRPEQFGMETVIESLAVPFKGANETVGIRETTVAGVPVYFVDAPRYFGRDNMVGYVDDGDRFILFCRAALEMCRTLEWAPDVIHAHEWHTAIVPNWLHTIYRHDPVFSTTASVFTIHNMAYQGIFGHRILEVAGLADQAFDIGSPDNGKDDAVDLLGRGITFADIVTTVSETYADEILKPEFGEGLEGLLQMRENRLEGVLNGIDAEAMNPATDIYINQQYDADHLELRAANKRALQEQANLRVNPDVPLIGFVSRLIRPKGCELLADTFDQIISLGAQIIIIGTGEPYFHEVFAQATARHEHAASVQFTFGADWTQPLYAGADMYLMPSRFEPCGLNQMIAMRYGAIPIVRATGGLIDTVMEFDPSHESGTGFVFGPFDKWAFFGTIARAVQAYRFRDEWHELMRRAMRTDHSWRASAERYIDIYERALAAHISDVDMHHPSDFETSVPGLRDVP